MLCVLCALPCGAFIHHKEHEEEHKGHKDINYKISRKERSTSPSIG
jgi:hypothetical protein